MSKESKDEEPEAPKETPLYSACVIVKPQVIGVPCVVKAKRSGDDEDEDEGGGQTISTTIDKDIISQLKAAGYTIKRQVRRNLTKAEAVTIMGYLSNEAQFDEMTDALTAGAVLALDVGKQAKSQNKVIKELNGLIGVLDPAKAREEEREGGKASIRGSYGKNAVFNAAMVSSSEYGYRREINILFPPKPCMQTTFAMLKPDAMQVRRVDDGTGKKVPEKPYEKIIALAESKGFVVVGRKEATLTEAQAIDMYQDSSGKSWFKKDFLPYITGNKVMMLALQRDNAVEEWRQLIGPADVKKAVKESPSSIRATWGSTKQQNAVHGAADEATAQASLALWFPSGFEVERTLALIKPGAADEFGDDIMGRIVEEGFTILAKQRVLLTKERAEMFYAEHRRRSFFGRLTDFMASGPIFALVLAKPGAIKHWRVCCGPTNTFEAQQKAPDSIRALYGVDGTDNAVHGSDSVASADREISFFFPQLLRSSLLQGADARKYLSTTAAGESTNRSLHSVLIEGLTELCKVKPAGLDAVRWLGTWLKTNNPNRPRVEGDGVEFASPAGGPKIEMPDESPTVDAGALPEAVVVEESAPVGQIVKAPPMVVFVLGGPGCGKGTMCERIVKTFGFVHLSTGDLLRKELERESSLGKEIKDCMEKGQLVPTETVLRLLKEAMARSNASKFLVDGFPRQLRQAFMFEQQVAQCHFCLYLDCSDETMTRRIMKRGETSGRSDDNAAAAANRLKVYREHSVPVIDFYKKLGRVHEVNAEQPIESVWAACYQAFLPRVISVLGSQAGRDAQCERIVSDYGYQRLVLEQLMEAEVATGSKMGRLIAKRKAADRILELNVTIDLFKRAMDNSTASKFVLDGFPRSVVEAKAYEEKCGSPEFVLNLATAAKSDVADFYKRVCMVRDVDDSEPVEKVWLGVRGAMSPKVYFVLGAPSSGKGSVCAQLAKEFGYVHLCVSDLIKAEVARYSEDGVALDRMIRSGQIVPTSMTLRLLDRAMSGISVPGYIIDGFPRALDQAKAFEERVAEVTGVVQLVAADATLQARAGGGDAERFEKRLNLYKSQSLPVVNYYAHRGIVTTVSADGAPEEVYAEVRKTFCPKVVFALGLPCPKRTAMCKQMASEFGYTHISPDDLLRAETSRGTPRGKMLKDMLSKGKITPSSDIMMMLKAAMRASGSSNFVIDGFPRAQDQLASFNKHIKAPATCLLVDVSAGNAKADIQASGSALSDAAIDKSFDTYEKLTAPMLAGFEEAGALIKVNANASNAIAWSQLRQNYLPTIVLLLGSTGSGRGDVATFVGREYGFSRIHASVLMEREAEMGSADGLVIAKCMENKRTCPMEIACRLVKAEMLRLGGNGKFLLDGFPRVVSMGYPMVHDQAFYLEETLGPVAKAVMLECSKEKKVERCGDLASVEAAADTFAREKASVAEHYKVAGKLEVVNTNVDEAMYNRLSAIFSAI